MFHRLCLHRNHNLHHTITQDEDKDKNCHLWPYGFWIFVRSFFLYFLKIKLGALGAKLPRLAPRLPPQLTGCLNY